MHVYLAQKDSSKSWQRALELGFNPLLVTSLPLGLERDTSEMAMVAMLTPDQLIGPVYRDFIARARRPLTLILAHGYAVYSGDLKPSYEGDHEAALFAPKAIGPKLRSEFQASRPHRLVAGFHATESREKVMRELATGLGFDEKNLVRASFAEEAVGDLISEQTLLCGTVFTFLEWTMQAMSEAGVPEALIAEECLTELELIAGLLREKGPASTFRAISQAAQCGTVLMASELEKIGCRELVKKRAEQITSKQFVSDMRDENRWKGKAAELHKRLSVWEKRLKKGDRS